MSSFLNKSCFLSVGVLCRDKMRFFRFCCAVGFSSEGVINNADVMLFSFLFSCFSSECTNGEQEGTTCSIIENLMAYQKHFGIH